MTAQTKRIAVFGAGLIGREHVDLIAAHPDCTLVALCDPDPESATYAQAHGAAHFKTYESMFDRVRPDGVIIALPNQLHEAGACACLARDIPCLIEKPIADTLEAAWRITRAAEQSSAPVLIGHQRRHSPDIRKAKHLIETGALGPLVAVNGMTLFDKPDDYFNALWRTKAGGGVLLINLIHDIDSLRYLVGEIESISALTSSATRGFEVEDTAGLVIRFQNGVIGTFIISDCAVSPWAWEYTSGQALYHPSQPGACLFLTGRKAALSVSDLYLWRHQAPHEHWQHPLVREHHAPEPTRTYVNQLEHFLAVIAGTTPPLITARDGLMSLAATLAVARAGQTQSTVHIADLLAETEARA